VNAQSKLRFAQYLLPGIVFQSVLIGGAYATGREIVEYGARFGPTGVWSILAIFIGFSVTSILAFEFARVAQVYDYRGYVRELIGPLWPLFDVLYLVMAIVVIAVVGAASGSVFEEIIGAPYWLGVLIVIIMVGILNARGRVTIERFKTFGSLVLYGGYLVFAGVVVSKTWGNTVDVFQGGGAGVGDSASIRTALFIGILYVGYNLVGIPATMFTLDRQTSRRQTVTAGLICGVLSTVPFILTYVAIMGFYPDEAVLGAPVPWLEMLRETTGDTVIWIYAFVILWTLIETATGHIHAVTDRISVNLEEIDRMALTPLQAGMLSVGILLVSAVLSRLGLITLVAQGYSMLAYGFLLLFALPLMTVGVARIMRSSGGGDAA
jgi:uncharacterized membrane protein YkvI